ncbi:MAG TPA: hypothetical protein VMH79_14320 [Thermoanaerobaculia bacterium]|nr:hypothetical protein [Thermoanaerobaculia bacterium]
MKRRSPILFGILLLVRAALEAQTTNTQPGGVLFPTQNSAHVNGVTIQETADGTVWFLESSADIIARLKDGVMRQWQIRSTANLGANPVVFQIDEIDGDIIWFIESGESLIPAGTCGYARLDTSTGQLTEWVVPGTIPATFYRSPDGLKVWLPQSAAILQELECSDKVTPFTSCAPANIQVTNWRSSATYAYADMVVAPDGAFWLIDFGNNRIVRWVPEAPTETSWTFFPLTSGRLNPSQLAFDDQGMLWITERSGDRVDRFDPATNLLSTYTGILAPIHFEIFQGRVYITSIETTSQLTVLDPALAVPDGTLTLTPFTFSVGSALTTIPVTQLQSVVVPTDFTSAPATMDPTQFTITNPVPGNLTMTFPSSNTYGIEVVGGRIWAGTDGNLAAFNVQTVGVPTDRSVPMATTLAGAADSRVRIDTTVSNSGTATISGAGYYLYSPAQPTPRLTFQIASGGTTLIPDSFGTLAGTSTLLNGPIRLGLTSGDPTLLSATVRSLRTQPDGGTFGYLLPAQTTTTSLQKDSVTTLFTGAETGDVSILNLYSLDDAKATLTLFGPDGTMRATRNFDVAKNASLSFNPAASAFGTTAEPGDAVVIDVTTGTLQSSVLVFSAGTTDVLPSLPAAASANAVIPWVGDFPNGDRSFVSDLYLSNPSADTAAQVTVTFYGIGVPPSAPANVLLDPLQTLAIPDVLAALFGVTAGGQGALTLTANVPVAASARVATQVAAGDYGTFANALDASAGATAGHPQSAIGLPQTATRSGLLLFFNSGAAGTATVTGFKADGTTAGTLPVNLGTNQAAVVGPVFAALGVSNQEAGRVRLDAAAGMTVFGWAAAVDGVTGDIDLTPLQ